MKFKKSSKFYPKNRYFGQQKNFAGKTSVGNHLHRAEGGTCAKFQPNRVARLGDPEKSTPIS